MVQPSLQGSGCPIPPPNEDCHRGSTESTERFSVFSVAKSSEKEVPVLRQTPPEFRGVVLAIVGDPTILQVVCHVFPAIAACECSRHSPCAVRNSRHAPRACCIQRYWCKARLSRTAILRGVKQTVKLPIGTWYHARSRGGRWTRACHPPQFRGSCFSAGKQSD